jgi:hypothetical protein
MWPCHGMSWPALCYSMTATCCKHLCSAFRTWCWNYSECTLYYFLRSENLEITLKITHSIFFFLCVSDLICSETFHCVWVMSIHGCIHQFNPFRWFLFMAGYCASTISATAGHCASTISATAGLFLCQVKCMCITLSTCYSSSVPVECDPLSDPALHHYSTTTACVIESHNILAQFSEGYMWTK